MSWNLSIIYVCLLALAATSAGSVYTKHRARTLFTDIQRLNNERDDLNSEWSRLQLEQSAWSTHGRLESVAREKLGMVLVTDSKMVLVKP